MLEKLVQVPSKIRKKIVDVVKAYAKLCEEHDYSMAYEHQLEQEFYKFP